MEATKRVKGFGWLMLSWLAGFILLCVILANIG
jgi:hypothetical protein